MESGSPLSRSTIAVSSALSEWLDFSLIFQLVSLDSNRSMILPAKLFGVPPQRDCIAG